MIKCPVCGAGSVVTDSRVTGQATRRRRKCVSCGERWTTYEVGAAFIAFAAEVAENVGSLSRLSEQFSQAITDYEVDRYSTIDVMPKARGRGRKRT